MNLVMFTGTECPHCDAMRPLVMKLQFETGISFDERDVWKSESDFRLLENYQVATGEEECRGLPFFYNPSNGDFLCGEVNYKTLKTWATKNSVS